ncbi:Clc1 protein [Saccharomycopsis crataegensis]|uniref:Clathrin light chain n=1 Tax=Saccharomycopsis crataegensis TaxID=43959 RepID=A0AAV5QIM8_9ASCO|nr:Clc1 protein [Saccharomycopsis crataegensis]
MAEKFPPIENLDINDDPEGDFLSREKAALGDEFATEDDQKILEGDNDDDEISQFQSQFPDVNEPAAAASVEYGADDTSNSDIFVANEASEESEPIKKWRAKRESEIDEKDKISAARHEEIVTEARGLIDQFYEDYNSKKEVKINQVKDEEAAFISKRDDFFKNDLSIWDRSIKLIDLKKTSGSTDNGRDKTKFKELLLSLKGKADAPGAAGY